MPKINPLLYFTALNMFANLKVCFIIHKSNVYL